MTTSKSELPIVPFASREAWETWPEGLKLAKKGSGLESVSFAEALDGALC